MSAVAVLTKEEVSTVVNARRILRQKGLDPNTDVKTLCGEVGKSRKTVYKWADRYHVPDLSQKINDLESKVKIQEETLANAEKEHVDLRFKVDCHKAAWEIHGVDELLLKKKDRKSRKNKKL